MYKSNAENKMLFDYENKIENSKRFSLVYGQNEPYFFSATLVDSDTGQVEHIYAISKSGCIEKAIKRIKEIEND